ncbi:hypothetical protein [Polyangium mundeleinium]|uniref:Secreted protein n=1 Tax=Polyangium mundeleinium TaxID=2995306 RepID=A0ABT5EDE6_9BACT|nr:hypothetical protein [Polyangium mundeleinium]MDC0739846.1 hypothetical protein [Polyangium mundeleinium]
MKRRRTFAAIVAIAIPIVVTLGLMTRRAESEMLQATTCESDLRSVFEMCERGREKGPCEHVSEAFEDACQAGCVAGVCPEQTRCTGRDPLWCATCTDMQGALFWDNLFSIAAWCDGALGVGYAEVDGDDWDACLKEEVGRQCPEIRGTDWFVRMRERKR